MSTLPSDERLNLPAMDNTLGALFIGIIVAMGLWTVGCMQLYYYHHYNRHAKDGRWLTVLTSVVWCLDTVHQGLITHTVYTYLITEYNNRAALGIFVLTLAHEVIVSAIICFIVQCFLVWRVWKLSRKNIYVVSFLMLLVVGELSVSIAFTIKAYPLKTFENLTKIVNLSRSVNILAASGDVAIAATLIFLLNRQRTGFQQSESVINRLIIFTINTGALTSACAIGSVVTITVLPNTFIYIAFFVNMSKLYTNTLFATLNARGALTDDKENGHSAVSMNHLRSRLDADKLSSKNPRTVSVKIDTVTTRDGCDESPLPYKTMQNWEPPVTLDISRDAGSDDDNRVVRAHYYGADTKSALNELPV